MPKVRSRTLTSLRDAKKATKRSAAGSLVRIRDEGINVRVMEDPDDVAWVEYREHYVDDGPDKGYHPCTEDYCEYCEDGNTPTKRFLINAINLDDNNKVVPLVIPTTVASSLIKKCEIFGTLKDRDYTITREGSGRETEYEATPQGPRPMNLNRYQPLELNALLQSIVDGEAGDEVEDDEEEEEEEVTPRRIAKRPAGKAAAAPVRRIAKKAAPEPRRIAKAAPATRVARKPVAEPEPRVARKPIKKAAGRPIRRAT